MASGASHPRERLAGLLWSERGDRQARDSLKQALMRLRRGLGAGGAALGGDRRSIALDRAAVEVDVVAFERLVRDGTSDALAEATMLYRGDLLDGIAVHDPSFDDWLLVRLRQLFERALASLIVLSAVSRFAAGSIFDIVDPTRRTRPRRWRVGAWRTPHAAEAQDYAKYDTLGSRVLRLDPCRAIVLPARWNRGRCPVSGQG